MQSFPPIHMAVKKERCVRVVPHRRGSHFACVSMNTFSQPLFFGMICFILFAKVGVIFQSNKFFKILR